MSEPSAHRDDFRSVVARIRASEGEGAPQILFVSRESIEALEEDARSQPTPLRALCLILSSDEDVARLADSGSIRGVERLELVFKRGELSAGGLSRLFRDDVLPHLTELSVSATPPRNDDTQADPSLGAALGGFGRLEALRSLSLRHCCDLAQHAPRLRSLESLELSVPVPADLIGFFAQAACRLRALRISDTDGHFGRKRKLDRGAVAAALRSPACAELESLDLTSLEDGGVAEDLAGAELAPGLLSLTLNHCGRGAVEGLRRASRFTSLRELDLWGTYLRDEGAEQLAHFGQIERLGVGRCGLSASAIDVVLAREPRVLRLLENDLGDEGARRIARSERAATLRELSLSGAGISGAGLVLLAISPHLRDLVELDTLNVLDERPLTAAALTTLAETQWPAMRRLRFDGGGNARTKRAMARRWSAVASDFERVWAIRDDAPAGRVEPRPFDAQARYAPGELVQHPTEGRVVVCDLSEGATRFVGLDGWVIADRPVEGAVPYSPRERYAPNQRVEHPKFGVGVVVLDRGDRVDIDFGVRGGVRTLVHGR